jgi:hypothetical protein
MNQIRDYLLRSLGTFVADPPDDDYQRGYKAALVEVYTRFYPKGAHRAYRVDNGNTTFLTDHP